ncbi:probable elongator complex protein 2 isoform X2 [Amphibalanus amphitrite]|uniref:probable elongator complex protein 2 isoform X2 n=1 Tax=Amphibalanus amphitrite TaxID=1232801 RepID=UPI001C902E07|nr:probable elongator complex protein 2 isoform X2 [Amphibalanus amphitrite]
MELICITMSSQTLRVTSEYISVGCSSTPHSLDWGDGERLCFGACHALAVAVPLPGSDAGFRTEHTLHHHSGEVVSVRWARDVTTGAAVPAVVTGSRDHTAAVWDLAADPPAVAARLTGHAGPVTLVDAVRWSGSDGGDRLLVATTSTDCSIRLWEGQKPADVALLQNIPLGRGLALALRLAQPPSAAAPWLFVGTDEATVVIYAPEDSSTEKENVSPTGGGDTPAEGASRSAEYTPLLRLAGHEDWVRCLDTVVLGDTLLLASAGQDAIIRVWSVCPVSSSGGDSAEDPSQLKVRSQTLSVAVSGGARIHYSVTLDSVLAGHEGWVYGLRWRPSPNTDPSSTAAPQLASASMDRAVLIWKHDASAGVWVEEARLGAMGGNVLGLYGCAWSPDGSRLAAHSHRGAMHVWAEDATSPGVWRGQVPPGGHTGPVADLAWAPGGGYLLTTSRDQTTRLHGSWTPAGSWHEMGRPQVHGHDMACLTAVTDTSFASGAEEKVARAFAMPGAVRDTLVTLCGAAAAPSAGDSALPEGAAVPSLGLTNKPVFAGEERREMITRAEEGAESYFLRQQLTAPPAEETLLQNTLWPELMKLYGHGFELVTMAASHDGKLLATACRAAKPEHASVLLWDTATWRQVGELAGAHQLTVVQLAFSPDDVHLLAVSRDRTWSLWARVTADEAQSAPYQLCARGAKAHARIIWCCAWVDCVTFVTGSRDGQLSRWRRAEDGSWIKHGDPYKPGAPVTAVAATEHSELVAVGLETGEIRLLTWRGDAWAEAAGLDTSAAHHGAVKRLQFRPRPPGGAAELLASCGADHAVKLHKVR